MQQFFNVVMRRHPQPFEQPFALLFAPLTPLFNVVVSKNFRMILCFTAMKPEETVAEHKAMREFFRTTTSKSGARGSATGCEYVVPPPTAH